MIFPKCFLFNCQNSFWNFKILWFFPSFLFRQPKDCHILFTQDQPFPKFLRFLYSFLLLFFLPFFLIPFLFVFFLFNMQDFIWEKRRSRFSRRLKNRTYFRIAEIVFLVIFPHFFCTSESCISISVPLFTYKMPDFLQAKKNRHFCLFLVLDIEIFLGGITAVKLFKNI